MTIVLRNFSNFWICRVCSIWPLQTNGYARQQMKFTNGNSAKKRFVCVLIHRKLSNGYSKRRRKSSLMAGKCAFNIYAALVHRLAILRFSICFYATNIIANIFISTSRNIVIRTAWPPRKISKWSITQRNCRSLPTHFVSTRSATCKMARFRKTGVDESQTVRSGLLAVL